MIIIREIETRCCEREMIHDKEYGMMDNEYESWTCLECGSCIILKNIQLDEEEIEDLKKQ